MKFLLVVLSLAIVLAAILISGRFETIASQQNGSAILFVTDRFTGRVLICGIAGCRQLPTLREGQPGAPGAS